MNREKMEEEKDKSYIWIEEKQKNIKQLNWMVK